MKNSNLLSLIFACILITSNTISAQIHIKGNVEIDMTSGLFNCDFNLTNIPELKDYCILLNKGMNIKYFKDSKNELIDYSGHYNGKMQGEAIAYTFKNDSATHILPEFNITYKGAFPVYENDFNRFDHKGIIAFNNETVRATEQAKWYPVIYDATNDKLLHSYTYDLTIRIKGGNSIFINGTAPKKEKTSHFISKKAYPLFLFVGNYDFIENKGNYIINTSVSKETSEQVFKNIESIKSNLSKNLDLKFTDHIYLINHKAINKRKKGSSWGFNTYPTFAFTGLNFDKILDDKGNFSNDIYRYFGHEFGHNYFGNNVTSGKLSWFWLESFAEYLSYNVAEDLCGKEFLKQVLTGQLENIKEDSFIPLHKIEHKNEIGEKYRYILAPLMLKCFEDRFGRNKMNLIIKSLLEFAENETLTLQHWKESAMKNGILKVEFEEFEMEFIKSEKFSQNIINHIKKNYG
ncbi:MAG: M1 family aminopeptidase [Saonia sp.]